MEMPPRRGSRTAAWNARPFPPPTLTYSGLPPDEPTRALAETLVSAYPGTLSLRWICDVHVAPAHGSLFKLSLRERFPEGQAYDLGAFEYTWREPPAASVPTDLRGYAALIYEQVEDTRRELWSERYDAWVASKPPASPGWSSVASHLATPWTPDGAGDGAAVQKS